MAKPDIDEIPADEEIDELPVEIDNGIDEIPDDSDIDEVPAQASPAPVQKLPEPILSGQDLEGLREREAQAKIQQRNMQAAMQRIKQQQAQDPRGWTSKQLGDHFKKNPPRTIQEQAQANAALELKKKQEERMTDQLLPPDLRKEKPVEIQRAPVREEKQSMIDQAFSQSDSTGKGLAEMIEFGIGQKIPGFKLTPQILQALEESAKASPMGHAAEAQTREEAVFAAPILEMVKKPDGMKALKSIAQAAAGQNKAQLGDVFRELGVDENTSSVLGFLGSLLLPSNLAGGKVIAKEIPKPNMAAAAEVSEGLYQKYVNRFQSLENLTEEAKKAGTEILPGNDPGLRARSYLGVGGKVQSALEDQTFRTTAQGGIETTGEGLKPILDDFDSTLPEKNSKVREQDLKDYLISKRTIEDLQRKAYEESEDLIASPEQTMEAKEAMSRLQAKYGDNFKVLETTANRLYDYQKRVLSSLVDSGNMSQQQFDEIIQKNPHYIPFDRVLPEEEFIPGAPISKNRFTGARSPIKKIKGSDLEIHDPVESIIKNTYRIMDAAERNTVSRSVAKLSEVLPEKISPVDPKRIPVAMDEITLQVDPVLKGKLKATIDSLRGTLQEKFNIGGKGRLGYFHRHNEIVTKIGTREDVLAHELGHFMDARYGLAEKLVSNKETNAELRILADKRYEGIEVTPHFKSYVREGSEKVAALVDAYITKPHLLDEFAPKSKKFIQDLIANNPELKHLEDARPGLRLGTEQFTKKIFGQSPFIPKGRVIEYFDDGKRKFIEVDQNLYDAMKGMNETSAGLMVKILSIPSNWLRTGATITPEFMARNPIRDQFTAFIQTKFGFKPFFDSAGAVADIMGKKEAYYDWLRAGGAYSSFTELSRGNLKKMLDDLRGKPDLLKGLNIVHHAQDISQLMEQATRVGTFKSAVESGLSKLEAGFESRESTLDFARRGSQTKDVNSLIAFFNAGLQGFDKSMRVFQENLGGAAAKATASITIPSVIFYLRNRKDPDYAEIPRWQKDLFWITKLPGSKTYIRIPKPFLYGQLFGSMPERFMEFLETRDPKAFDGFLKTLSQSSPVGIDDPVSGLLPTGIKPLVENQANWSFFRQRQIVPEYKTKLLPEEQYDKYTTETAKEIGKMTDRSPSKIENTIQGFFGGSGRYALEAGDAVISAVKKAKGEEIEPKRPKELADIPFVKGFVTRPPGAQSESVNKFYENYEKAQAAYLTWNKLRKEKKTEDAQRVASEHPEMLLYKKFKNVADDLSKISKKIDQIVKTKNEDSVKKQNIENLERERVKLAKQANKLIGGID